MCDDTAATAAMHEHINHLKTQIASTETLLSQLRQQLAEVEQHFDNGPTTRDISLENESDGETPEIQVQPSEPQRPLTPPTKRWPLEADEYRRYGRQIIMPEVGLHGQLKLKQSRILIVGVGGLGCPAAAYLAGAGVGTLGLMDGDTVELSNLHRQIAHNSSRLGMSKVESAQEYLTSLNPLVNYRSHPQHVQAENALAIIEQYDVVLDCTDHPTSRYLISDACVLAGKPLVSASALRTEGQLIVLNNPPLPPGGKAGGPCYRCVFPKPPPADSVLACGEAGILGPVVGVMGVLQALEAVKLLVAKPEPAPDYQSLPQPTLLIFTAFGKPQFRSVRMRSRRAACAACSSNANITRESLTSGSVDYVAFCGLNTSANVLSPEARVNAEEFARLSKHGSSTLVDIRDETQYTICALPASINVPWTGDPNSWYETARQNEAIPTNSGDYFVVCRFGNDSQLAVKTILDRHPEATASRVKDIKGGLRAWRDEVDSEWPDY